MAMLGVHSKEEDPLAWLGGFVGTLGEPRMIENLFHGLSLGGINHKQTAQEILQTLRSVGGDVLGEEIGEANSW